MLVPVDMPTMTVAKLRKPYYVDVFGFGFTVSKHYFCEGNGVKVRGTGPESAYDKWLAVNRNTWWRRLLGAPEYKIPMREQTEEDIYTGIQPLEWPPIDLGLIEGTK